MAVAQSSGENRSSPARIFGEMRRGLKPPLNPLNQDDAKLITTLFRMAKDKTLSDAPDLYYSDFGLGPLSREQAMRLKSQTDIQSVTFHMAHRHRKIMDGLGDLSSRVTVMGEVPFDRMRKISKLLRENRGSLLVLDGNQFEAEIIAKKLYARSKKAQPLFIFNPNGFWDDLLSHSQLAAGAAMPNVHVCSTLEELREKIAAHTPANVASLFKRTGAFTIEPGASMPFASNATKKRADKYKILLDMNANVRLHFVGDLTLSLLNAEEEQGTGTGNAFDKMVETIRLYHGRKNQLHTEEGHDPKKSRGMVSDIVMEFQQSGLAKHPYLKEYRHVLKAGQKFPGTEMAKADKCANMDTLMFDVNRAFDEMESRGIKVDRRIRIQTVIYIFPMAQKLPPKPDPRNVIFLPVSGEQFYTVLKTPVPNNPAGNDIEEHIAFVDDPKTSIAQIQMREGRIPLETHNARALRAVDLTIGLPKRDIAAPAIKKPIAEALIITDRHFMKTWTGARDVFNVKAVPGYRFADTWHGGTTYEDTEAFLRSGDAFVFLDYDYTNPNDSMEVLRKKVERLQLYFAHKVGDELADPFLRGRPRIIADKVLQQYESHKYRLGLINKHPLLGAAWMDPKTDDLGQKLAGAWMRGEVAVNPRPTAWDSSPLVPRPVKEFAVAYTGSAKTYNKAKNENAGLAVRLGALEGWSIRDGHGGEGEMGAFAKSLGDLCREGHKNIDYHGVTTLLAAIERKPVWFKGTYLENNFTVVETRHLRVRGIFLGAHGVCARGAGTGTDEETIVAACDNLNGKNRLIVLDTEAVPYRDEMLNPHAHLLAMFTPWERRQLNMVECDGPTASFQALRAHFAGMRKRALQPFVA